VGRATRHIGGVALDGVRVLDSATPWPLRRPRRRLADLGAECNQVEAHNGDFTRALVPYVSPA